MNTRRSFIRLASSSLVFPHVAKSSWAKASPANRLNHASFGGQGMAARDLRSIATHPSISVRAIAEIDPVRRKKAEAQFKDAKVYSDWREMLEKEGESLDTANVSTPDHMHAAQAMLDGDVPEAAAERGQREERDMLDAFVDHVMSFVDVSALKPMRVVADTANGMGGLVVPALFERLPMIELEVMYGELDGTFPNHPADPLQPANQRDLQARVVSGGFDIGLAFDGDADRVFIVDEKGVGLSGSVTTAILAVAMLRDHPGSTILHNLICSKAVPETISAHGGNPVRTRVGHSYIKTEMASRNAVFGGEHSAHYYFADNFRADSGLIASLIMISELARSGSTLSEMRTPYEPYVASGEINTVVDDPSAVIDRVRDAYSHCDLDELDGLTVDAGEWWFNLRPSNTEPLLRLNLEAADVASCDAHVAEVLDIITA